MNASTIMNVEIMQRRMFYTSISMNVFGNINALMVQRRGVVRLIAQGWRGTSLPWVNVRKEIQRCKC